MKPVIRMSYAALAACIAGAALPGIARAQSRSASPAEAAGTVAYWTAERLMSARPMILTTTRTFSTSTAIAAPTGPTTVVPGGPPSVPYDGSLAEQLYLPQSKGGPNLKSEGGPNPAAVGSGN